MKDKKTALVMVDDIIIERGYIKVTKIITVRKSRSYEILFFGDNTEWMTELNNTTLDELSFNNNAQVFSQVNIQNSWTRTFDDGDDHVYPWISYGTYRFINGVSVEDIRPAIRYRAIVERGLEKAGFTLTSNLMDGANWKQLIHPHVGDKFVHSEAVRTDKLFKASSTALQTFTLNSPVEMIFPDDSTGDNFDNGAHYNSSTNKYIIDIDSKYRFQASLLQDQSSIGGGVVAALLFKNGILLGPLDPLDIILDATHFQGKALVFRSGYFFLEAGDEIDFRIAYSAFPGTQFVTKAGSSFSLIDLNPEIHRFNPFNLSDVVPEINVLSLFSDITKLFNLYWRTDNKSKRVYVEDRDNFFKPITEAVDWGDKLDVSREYTLSFLLDYKKEIIFSYTDDPNDAYLIQRNKDKLFAQNKYCSYRHVMPDRFPKGIHEIKTEEIAATYVIADSLATPSTNTNHPLTSRIWDEANPQGAAPEPSYSFNPRILNFKYDTQTDFDGNALSWRFEFTDRALIPSALAVSVFGNDPAISLTFAQIDGLVDDFYTRTLGVIEEGTQLTAWMNLTVSDYLNFDMRDIVYLSSPDELHGYWIVDTIHDYNPLIQPTQVTFLRFHNQDSSGEKVIIDEDWGGNVMDDLYSWKE